MNDDAIRCSDTERQRAQALLRQALGRGQISISEFDERVQQCLSATTRGELLVPINDLMVNPRQGLFGSSSSSASVQDARFALKPAHPRAGGVLGSQSPETGGREDSGWGGVAKRSPGAVPTKPPEEVAFAANQLVTGESPTRRPGLSLFSTVHMQNWVVPERYELRTIFGDSTLDLCSARFAAHETTISIVTIFGDVAVKVPEGVRVVVDNSGVLGETRLRVANGAVRPENLPADAPVVWITGVTVFGDVRVIVKRVD